MGIDARILLKVKGEKPTDGQLKTWSWALCRAIGPEHFTIRDGLLPDEYNHAVVAWHSAFENHPCYDAFNTSKDYSFRNLMHKSIVADIGPGPEERRLAIELADGEEDQPGKVYIQDGPDVCAEEGEWLLEVNLQTRYYGIGYERGDLLTICAVAEWCEANIPDCTVWYGGDSSGACVILFDDVERAALRKHFYSESGREYFNRGIDRGLKTLPPVCSLCPESGSHFNQFGYGSLFASLSCGGCGLSFETRDSGATWQKKSDK